MYNKTNTIYGSTNLAIYIIHVIDAASNYNILYYAITRADRFTRSKRFSQSSDGSILYSIGYPECVQVHLWYILLGRYVQRAVSLQCI